MKPCAECGKPVDIDGPHAMIDFLPANIKEKIRFLHIDCYNAYIAQCEKEVLEEKKDG